MSSYVPTATHATHTTRHDRDALTADGGAESQCGWLKDKYGLSWQVVPDGWEQMYADQDATKVQRAMTAMFGMKKLNLAELQAAFDGDGAD